MGCGGYGNVEGVIWDVEGMGMWRVWECVEGGMWRYVNVWRCEDVKGEAVHDVVWKCGEWCGGNCINEAFVWFL